MADDSTVWTCEYGQESTGTGGVGFSGTPWETCSFLSVPRPVYLLSMDGSRVHEERETQIFLGTPGTYPENLPLFGLTPGRRTAGTGDVYYKCSHDSHSPRP